MTITTEVKKELTVGRYKFFKEQGRSDASVAKQYGMDSNQFQKWKKEKDLIGVKFEKAPVHEVKTFQASEVEPLREKNLPEKRLKETYSPNQKVQEKLAEKKPAPSWDQVKELAGQMTEEMKTEVLAAAEESVKAPAIQETPNDQAISLQEQLDNLLKEKAYLEERHVKDTAEKDQLLESLKKYQQLEQYQELMRKVSEAVTVERHRQNSLYGHQRHDSGKWLMILMEEVGEVAQAMQRGEGWGKDSDADDLFKELIHVSAVSKAWAEQVLEERESVQEMST